MEGAAAQMAVENVMVTPQAQLQAQQFLINNMDGSVKEFVNDAVNNLTSDLHSRMQAWEEQVETQINSRVQQHRDVF